MIGLVSLAVSVVAILFIYFIQKPEIVEERSPWIWKNIGKPIFNYLFVISVRKSSSSFSPFSGILSALRRKRMYSHFTLRVWKCNIVCTNLFSLAFCLMSLVKRSDTLQKPEPIFLRLPDGCMAFAASISGSVPDSSSS